MMSKRTTAAMTLALALGGLLGPQAASSQIMSASPAVLATANNYTALARGFAAIALNPAGLAMPGNPGFSLTLLPVQAQAGLSGMKLSEIATYDGQSIPAAVRQEWLTSVTEDGGFELRSGVSATGLALSIGPVGLQISTVGAARANLSPDAFELLMFGNAGLTGTTRDNMSLDGTEASSWAATTGALAVGIPLPGVQDGNFAMGATLKYTVGHVAALAADAGSVVRGDSIGLNLPSIINVPDDFSANPLSDINNNGTGVGLDLGLAWEGEKWGFSAAVQNVFHTFEWDLTAAEYRVGEVSADIDAYTNNFAVGPPTGATLALQSALLAQRFEPAINLGVAYRASEKLAVTADYRHETGETLVFGSRTRVGLGVEWNLLSFLPLRTGMSAVSGGGVQLGAGFGLELGPVQLSFAYLSEKNSNGEFKAASFALSFGG